MNQRNIRAQKGKKYIETMYYTTIVLYIGIHQLSANINRDVIQKMHIRRGTNTCMA